MSFILSLCALLAVGAFAALIILRRRFIEFYSLEFLGLSFFFGLGFINYQFFLFYFFNIRFELSNFILTQSACYIFVFYYFLRQLKDRQGFSGLSGFGSLGVIEKLFLVGVFCQLCWMFYLVLPAPVNSYDALASYAFKAKIFYLHKGIPVGFFNWNEIIVGHPDYPTLLPFFMSWVYLFTGFNDLVVTNIMPVTFVFFLILFYAQLKKIFNRQYALASVFIIATVPRVYGYAMIVHADIFMLAFITCAFLYFFLYIRHSNKEYLILSSVLFALSIWVKNEAVVFVFAFLLSLVFFLLNSYFRNKTQILKPLALVALVILVISGPWFMLKFSKHMANSDINFSALTLNRIFRNIKDIPIMFNEFQKQVFGVKYWNIFWVVAIGAVILNFKKLFKGEVLYITSFLAVSALCYFTAYMITTNESLSFYLEKTLSRFMIHFVGVFLFLTVYLFFDISRVKKIKLSFKNSNLSNLND